MKQVELHHGARSDVGLVREVNEDAYLASPPVFVVADGMGGHDGGDVASRIVVEEFGRLAASGYDPARGAEQVAATLAECQRLVADYGARQVARGRARGYAGTTVAGAVLVDDDGPQWLLVNLGDSRIYRLTDQRLEQVSVDHSVVQELVDAGTITREQAAHHPERHVITRALGGPQAAEADYFLLPLAATGRVLLCSDGISGMIADDEIEAVLLATRDPGDAADQLVERALAAGGQDNATAVVVDVVGWSGPEQEGEALP
jgi:PPM family protein phosphatase